MVDLVSNVISDGEGSSVIVDSVPSEFVGTDISDQVLDGQKSCPHPSFIAYQLTIGRQTDRHTNPIKSRKEIDEALLHADVIDDEVGKAIHECPYHAYRKA